MEWFVVGAKIWFLGFGPEVEITEINEKHNYWIGLDCDGYHSYPLNEVEGFWQNQHA